MKRVILPAVLSAAALLLSAGSASSSKVAGSYSSQRTLQPSPVIERKFHIINLSLPKTGTGSIAGIFSRYRAADEYKYQDSVDRILDWREGKIDGPALDAILIARDKERQLELDSASFLGMAVERVIPLFPKAKFLLCVRDGEEWVVSFVAMMSDHYGANPSGPASSRPWATRYGKAMAPGFNLEAFADPARLGGRVRPWLTDLAAYWGRTTLETLVKLKEVPANRRLILRVKDISNSLDRLAAFAGVPVASLDAEKSYHNKGKNLPLARESLGNAAIAAAVKPWQEKIDAVLAEHDAAATAQRKGNNDKPTSPSRLKK